MVKKSLYLAGGGARGAYQAGVLKAIGHILQTKTLPFDVVTGVSVGSINAAILAESAHDFQAALDKLEYIWGSIHCPQIYNASNYALMNSVLRNLSTLVLKQNQSGYLLNTLPLKKFIAETIDFNQIEENINRGNLKTLEVISLCYNTHQTISFYHHNQPNFPDWHNSRHSSRRTHIKAEHVLASSALPLFFPPTPIDGLHYGDGSIGLVAPLRGAIRFEVDKILIIGTREAPELSQRKHSSSNEEIPFSSILGNMFNGLFIDNLDRDIEMVNHMNEIATLLSIWKKRRSPWRPINTLYLRPSKNMGHVAEKHFKSMPVLLRFLLSSLGSSKYSGDLFSFLLFEKEFTRELLNLGFNDTISQADKITEFFN